MLTCPACGTETRQLVIPDQGNLGCRSCTQRKSVPYNVNLGQTWTRDEKTRLTTGKAWELENRIQSPDDPKVYINRITGRETQY